MAETTGADADTTAWTIESGFVDNERSKSMEKIQGRQFLATGTAPVVGQRVDLILKTNTGKDVRLSGQVVNVGPTPTELVPMTDEHDHVGSTILSGTLWEVLVRQMGFAFDEDDVGLPAKIVNREEAGGGLLCMSATSWELMKSGGRDLDGGLEREKKKDLMEFIHYMAKDLSGTAYGALNGQRVFCEGRLHFDYDMRRGSNEGPWEDGIPLDGGAVYSWELLMDDQMVNKWVLAKLTEDNADAEEGGKTIGNFLRNLGPDRHPRCWPWSSDNALPYQRTGNDRSGSPPLLNHLCIGPFGCTGGDHDHDFAEAA